MTTLYQQFNAALQRRLEANLVIAGELVATEVRRNIQKSPRGGKTYVKTNPNRVHKASAPGESPATDLGFWCDQFKYSLILITCASVLLAYIVLRPMQKIRVWRLVQRITTAPFYV